MAASIWKVCRTQLSKRNIFFSSRFLQTTSACRKEDDSKDQTFSSGKTNNDTFDEEETLMKDLKVRSGSELETVIDLNELYKRDLNVEQKQEEDVVTSDSLIEYDSYMGKSFASMLRDSKFVQLGNLRHKMVSGRIFDVQGDDLYIDFGGKFHCVCTRPAFDSDKYVRGSHVKLHLNKFEMTGKFLGSDKHITLLEADCTLMGIFDQTSLPDSPNLDMPDFLKKNIQKDDLDEVEETGKPSEALM